MSRIDMSVDFAKSVLKEGRDIPAMLFAWNGEDLFAIQCKNALVDMNMERFMDVIRVFFSINHIDHYILMSSVEMDGENVLGFHEVSSAGNRFIVMTISGQDLEPLADSRLASGKLFTLLEHIEITDKRVAIANAKIEALGCLVSRQVQYPDTVD